MEKIKVSISVDFDGVEKVASTLKEWGVANPEIMEPVALTELKKENSEASHTDIADLPPAEKEYRVCFTIENSPAGIAAIDFMKIKLMQIKSNQLYGEYGDVDFGRMFVDWEVVDA